MSQVLTVLALGRPQFDTLIWTALFLVMGWAIGRLMRLNGPVAAIMGFLTLMGSSDLALYAARAAILPVWTLAPLTLAAVVLIVVMVRCFLPVPPSGATAPSHPLYLPVLLLLCWICWMMSILTPDPSSAYAYYQAWTPLYARAAQIHGFFPMPQDMALGAGYLSNGIYYALDVQGLAILGGVLLPLDQYAAYNGAVIAGCMAALAVLASSVRHSFVGLLTYLVLGLVFYRYGNALRTVMGNNWGDVGLVAAGAAIAALLTTMPGRGRAALWAGFAATFLVFSRNFGAAYAAVILVAGFAFCRCRPFRSWLALGVVLAVFSTKEVLQVLQHGLYFPVAARFSGGERDWGVFVLGSLHDWGLVPDDAILGLPMGALWPAIGALVWLTWTRRGHWRPGSIMVVASPLLLLLAPLAVEGITGYRMSVHFSKLYILGLLLFIWYPAWLLSHGGVTLPDNPVWRRGALIFVVAAALVPLAWLVRRGPEVVIESYRANNTDLQMARAIMSGPPDIARAAGGHRLVYFHHEPGLTLRYFLGGDLTEDLDFYSDPFAKAAQGRDLAGTLAELGWPNLYFSYGQNAPHAVSSGYAHAVRLNEEIQSLDFDALDWVGKTIRKSGAVLVIPKANLDRESMPAR